MEAYCLSAGIPVDEWIQETGGGMNFRRKQFLGLIDRVMRGEIARLIVAHKDRLMRFGFDLFAHVAASNGCEVIVVNQPSLSPEQEVVQDLRSIIHTFSCRLYGLRRYNSLIQEDFPDAVQAMGKPETLE